MSGGKLRTNNERIVEYLQTLKTQRNEIQQMILKLQEEQKAAIQDLERLKYKLLQIDKSLVQRLAARDQYDRTIKEADENYRRIVDCSGILLCSVQKEYGVLSEVIDKRVGTAASKDQQPSSNDTAEPKDVPKSKSITSEDQSSSLSGSQSTAESGYTERSSRTSHTTESTVASRNDKSTSSIDNIQNTKGSDNSGVGSESPTIENRNESHTVQNTIANVKKVNARTKNNDNK